MFDHMNKQFLTSQLTVLGLDDIEAQIYVYLLENGAKTPLELSRETNIDRSKIYRSIEKLTKKKLLEQSNASWGKKIQAANPQNITLLVQEKEEILKAQKETLPQVIDDLLKLPAYSQKEFEIKHYKGVEGLKQMFWNQLSAKKEILLFGYQTRNEVVGKTFAEKIRTEQVARKIKLYEVENATDQGDYRYTDVKNWDKFYFSRHISPKELEIKQYLATYNNTVAIMNWTKGDEVGVEIINVSFADMQKQLFWKFWQMADK